MLWLKNNNRGMTLIETTVALGVLVVGLISILSLSFYSIKLSDISEKQVVGLNLAREGLELVRQIKDYSRSGNQVNVFLDEDKTFFGTGEDAIDGCYFVDSQDNFQISNENNALGDDFSCNEEMNIANCTNCWLYLNSETGFLSTNYNYERSMYKRMVRIENLEDDINYAKKVISKVYWFDKGTPKNVTLETVFYDW